MKFIRVIVAGVLFVTGAIRVSANALSIGGHTLGEKLSEFKRAYPTAVCGSPLHLAEVTNNPDVPDKRQLLGCCLDDPEQMATFSNWTILSAAHCHVLATFYQERLRELRYVVKVPTIDPLLGDFTREFGAAKLDQIVILNGVRHNRIVSWLDGTNVLSLITATVRYEKQASGPDVASDGLQKANVVIVHLWRAEVPTNFIGITI